MHGHRASRRPCHFKAGTTVQHLTLGVGKVRGEWGPVAVDLGKATRVSYPCPGIYDVEFVVGPHRVLHCCRGEYLNVLST
jgi:hypothetical protein